MLPLESLGDWLDISLVQNPWQMFVVLGLLFALLIWPQLSARQTVKRVEKTLTENNGGSSVKDALDEIKRVQAEQGKKLDVHVEWSEGYVRDTAAQLAELKKPPRRGRMGRGAK